MPSDMQKRKEAVKAKIKDIYVDSKQNYGAPKITKKLQKGGEIISERTVSKIYERNGNKSAMGKTMDITTKDSDFSHELQNILNEQFNPDFGYLCQEYNITTHNYSLNLRFANSWNAHLCTLGFFLYNITFSIFVLSITVLLVCIKYIKILRY